MVAHLLRTAGLGGVPAGAPRDPAQETPPHPPRGTARDLLLHHDRLAELAVGEAALLVGVGGDHTGAHRSEAQGRRLEVGQKGDMIVLAGLCLWCRAHTFDADCIYFILYKCGGNECFTIPAYFILSGRV